MKVLVAGGTGFIGTKLVSELLDRGHDVTVVSRNPSDDPLPTGAEAIAGDVSDYETIEGAVDGHDIVVNLVALSPLFEPKGGNEMHDKIHRGGTENLVRAAEAGDVSRFVQMSALGADSNGPTAYIRAKGQAEDRVTGSDLDWVIFRPSVIFGDGGEFIGFTKKLAPPYLTPLPGGGKTRFQPLWVGDLVPMLADAVENDEHVGETYELGGPEAFTLAEIARLVHGAEGRSTTVIPVPMSLAGIGLKIGGAIPGFPMGGDQYRSLTFDNTTDDNDIGAFGYEESDLTRLEDYLREK
ncbi:complex I NDUFA9 subunit family protein [Haloferacaceae archaeon DSL9]